MSASDAEVRAVLARWPHAVVSRGRAFGTMLVNVAGVEVIASIVNDGLAWKAYTDTTARPLHGAECRLSATAQADYLADAVDMVIDGLRRFRPVALVAFDCADTSAEPTP